MRGDATSGALSIVAAALLLGALVPMAAAAGPKPTSLTSTLEAPAWAVGFYWTYHYEGATDQSFAGFQATYLNDTYTAEVVGELATANGSAWLVSNTHRGTMTGTAPGGFPATATYDSWTYSGLRKSDLALLNFTQDLLIVVDLPAPFGTINGTGHNDTNATPPLRQMGFGTAADGTPWHVQSNFSSTGYYTIAGSPPVNVYSYADLDYNLSVNRTVTLTVPAGTFDAYNISGSGRADNNGTVYNFSEAFAWAPAVMNKVVDEFGYNLTSYYVNRPPAPTGALPVLNVTSGAGPAALDLSAAFADPEGDSFTLSCAAPANFTCSIDGNGVLSVTAAPGVNETATVTLRADDGLPGGNATYDVTVLASGPGNPNAAPVLVGAASFVTAEDTPFQFVVANHFSDSDGGIVGFTAFGGANVSISNLNAGAFDAVPAPDFNGAGSFAVFVYDGDGNGLNVSFALTVTPVNDPPRITAASPPELFFHEGDTVTASVTVFDVDGETPTVTWMLNGSQVAVGTTAVFAADAGNYTLTATAADAAMEQATVEFDLTVFAGPRLVSTDPPAGDMRLAAGSSVAFRAEVADPDTPLLNFTWQRNGTTVGSGEGLDNFTFSFPQPGVFQLQMEASDNGSSAGASWNVTVIAAPPGLVAILSPTNLSNFEANSTVSLSAFVDGNLTDVSLEWRVNGVPVPPSAHDSIGPLAPGTYRIGLSVNAVYAGTVNYSAQLAVDITVLPAAPQNNSTNGSNGHGTPPVDYSVDYTWLYIAIVAAAASAALYFYFRRKRPSPPEGAPPA